MCGVETLTRSKIQRKGEFSLLHWTRSGNRPLLQTVGPKQSVYKKVVSREGFCKKEGRTFAMYAFGCKISSTGTLESVALHCTWGRMLRDHP